MIDGIEVMSYKDFYPIAFGWCFSFKKAFMASSDAHCVLSGIYRKGLRPMTLVFSEERSEKGIREALFAGRTAALFDGKSREKKNTWPHWSRPVSGLSE